MTRKIYINGQYQPYTDALLHVEDRATLFADSVYEVIEIRAGNLVDKEAHFKRLERSLGEIRLNMPMSLRCLSVIASETKRRNRVSDGSLYIQVSRGISKRDFVFPQPGTAIPTLIMFARSSDLSKLDQKAKTGINVITTADLRWKRPDIKTTQLLASVLARQRAAETEASEAWFIDEEGFITEGAASNAWIINKEGELITRAADNSILKGITREGVRRVAKNLNLTFIERKITLEEAENAEECFISAATNLVMPVVKINEKTIKNGVPGSISLKLREMFHQFAELTR